jgi:hypothetical protein
VLGGVGAAIAAAPLIVPPSAPLYIPSERLEFGVPKTFVLVDSLERGDVQALLAERQARRNLMVDEQAAARMAETVPMLMLRDEYNQRFGGHLNAGSTVLLDPATAQRWATVGIAVPQNRVLHHA